MLQQDREERRTRAHHAATLSERDAAKRKIIDACARAAQHFGLVTCNVDARGEVDRGAVFAYEMHPGTVVVALHLAGLLNRHVAAGVSEWRCLEGIPAVFQSVVASAAFHLYLSKSPEKATVPGLTTEPNRAAIVPAALEGHPLPALREHPAASCVPLQWNAHTKSTVTKRGRHKDLTLGLVDGSPAPIVPEDKASLVDVFGWRCLIQAKFTAQWTGAQNEIAFAEEIRKAGLLTGSDARQRLTTDAMLCHWGRLEAAATDTPSRLELLKKCVLDYGPGRSTAGDRHMYPLSFMQGRSPHMVPAPSLYRSDRKTLEYGRMPSATSLPPQLPAEATAAYHTPSAATPHTDAPVNFSQLHSKHLEVRFVVSRMARFVPPHYAGAEASRTLGVFHRADVKQPWSRAFITTFSYVPLSKDGHPMTAKKTWAVLADNFAAQLRRDVDLTLIAITVCHVWCKAAPAPAPTGDVVDSDQKRHRGEEASAAASRASAS
jgi:hypothetical protein